MQLGLNKNEVRLAMHDDQWQTEFNKVRQNLIEQTSLNKNQIEHIGSTAIKEIKAKPIIDLLVGVPSINVDLAELEKELRMVNFYRLKVEQPNEIVFAKFTDQTFNVKTHYIHLVKLEDELWNNLIFFRDYLNRNKTARLAYERIKLDFVNKNDEGIEEYTNSKESFVKKIISHRQN